MIQPNLRDRFRFIVPPRKLTAYLLAPEHPDGGGKAKFFLLRGYSEPTLRAALIHCGRTGMIVGEADSGWGLRLAIRGTIRPPVGAELTILSVWQVDNEAPDVARLITAFPN